MDETFESKENDRLPRGGRLADRRCRSFRAVGPDKRFIGRHDGRQRERRADRGGRDFWGHPVSASAAPNIGAYEGPGLDPNMLPPLPPAPEDANLLANPGFETGDFAGWTYPYNGAAVASGDMRSGGFAARLTAAVSGAEQNVTGLKPNTMYRLSGYGKGASGGSAVLGVKNYGGSLKDAAFSGSTYSWREVVFTTGSADTGATVYLYKQGATGEVYFDDLLLIEYGPVPGASTELPPDPVFTTGESDEFDAAALDPQWNWIRENGQKWSLADRPGYMRITSEAGDIVDGQATAKNILLTGAPEGDWTIETKMDGKPTSQWSQGGLIVYESDQTYFRLTRLYGSGNQFQFTKQIDAAREHAETPDTIASTVSYLRIVKSGNTYSGHYSADGIDYTQVWTTQTADLVNPKIGLIACAGTGLVADFDYFRIIPEEGPSAGWNLIDDDMDDFAAGWSTTGSGGSATQHAGYANVADGSNGYYFLTKNGFAPPTGSFTFEVRAKAAAPGTTNEISVRSGSYNIQLFLPYGTSGKAQDRETAPTKSVTLDTTVFRDYRIVVHGDYAYDLYVDGELAWSGAASNGSGSGIFKLGGSANQGVTANLDVDRVRMGSGEIVP